MIALSSREGFHDDGIEVQPVVLTCLAWFNIHMTNVLMLMPNMSQQQLESQYIIWSSQQKNPMNDIAEFKMKYLNQYWTDLDKCELILKPRYRAILIIFS